MPISTNRKSYLDGKECFMLWYELQSTPKVRLNLASRGIINPETQKPFSQAAVWVAAVGWVIQNATEAREYYKKDGAKFAYNDDEWNTYLIRKAMYVYKYSHRKFFEWLKHNGFGDKYKNVYESKMGALKPHIMPGD